MSSRFPARVILVKQAASDMGHLHLEVPRAVWAQHQRPGQYTHLGLGALEPKPFALASVPNHTPHFEFLVKSGAPLADALLKLSPGDTVELSDIEGPGFPVDRAAGRPLVMAATGSGIAPLRAVIAGLQQSAARPSSTQLLYGAFTPAQLAYQDEFETWKRLGVRVVTTVGAPAPPTWRGDVGFVQDHLPAALAPDTVAFLSGHPMMVEKMSEALRARGVQADLIFLNT